MTNSFCLDARELTADQPAAIRARAEACREIRSNPLLLKCVEGLAIARATGWTDGFADRAAIDYIRRAGGDDAVARYLATDFASKSEELLALCHNSAWCATPLTTALRLTSDLDQRYAVAPHIRSISDALADAVSGRGPRNVIISLPPRYGKTEQAGRRGLEFFLANYPWLPGIFISHGDDSAASVGRVVRNDIVLHSELFGFSVADDSSAASRFNTSVGGALVSSGVLGQVVGKGAAFLVLDDLFKNSEQAGSATYRDTIWELWTTSFSTRRQSGSVLVVISTRWHSQDLIGRLLSGWGDAAPLADVRYLKFPALAEERDELARAPGDPLDIGPIQVPGFGYTREELLERKAQAGAETWETVYQQNPIDESTAGRAYYFDEKTHVRPVEIDAEQEILVGMDFNVDPFSTLVAQTEDVSDHRRLILANERIVFLKILKEFSLPDTGTASAVEELCEWLRRFHRGQKLRLRITGDASGNQRRTSSDLQSDWAIVKQHFAARRDKIFSVRYGVFPSNESVRQRVNRVNGLLKPAIGITRVYVDPECKELIHDLRAVRWARDASGNARDTLDKRDPKRTHMSDALGYLARAVEGGGRVGLVADSALVLGGGFSAR